MSRGLEIPPQVLQASRSVELARIWIADGDQCVAISSDRWEDPGVCGLMLVDLAKHFANAYAGDGVPRDVALHRIKAAFDAEWSHATGEPVQLGSVEG